MYYKLWELSQFPSFKSQSNFTTHLFLLVGVLISMKCGGVFRWLMLCLLIFNYERVSRFARTFNGSSVFVLTQIRLKCLLGICGRCWVLFFAAFYPPLIMHIILSIFQLFIRSRLFIRRVFWTDNRMVSCFVNFRVSDSGKENKWPVWDRSILPLWPEEVVFVIFKDWVERICKFYSPLQFRKSYSMHLKWIVLVCANDFLYFFVPRPRQLFCFQLNYLPIFVEHASRLKNFNDQKPTMTLTLLITSALKTRGWTFSRGTVPVYPVASVHLPVSSLLPKIVKLGLKNAECFKCLTVKSNIVS